MSTYRKDKTTAAQTSANVAGEAVAALINQGSLGSVEEVAEAVETIFDATFAKLAPIVDGDNALFAEVEAADAPARSSGGSSTKSRSRKSGGKATLASALKLPIKGGAFDGVTLGELKDITAEEADEDYGYGDGERTGADYLSWLASDNYNNEYLRERARLVADDAGISY